METATFYEKEKATYQARTPKSRALHEEARRYLPGGNTRTTVFFHPYPPYITRGHGCQLYDLDGNECLDFINNYTAVIVGHANEKVVEAVRANASRGLCFAAPTEAEVQLAKLLCQRLPSVDRIRFCNSGTEATMHALRAARAFTGRNKIAKFEGGYHGTHDYAEVSVAPPVDEAGEATEPRGYVESAGVRPEVLDEVVVLPFNNVGAAVNLIRRHKDELAAVLVDPLLTAGGVHSPSDSFLHALRTVTREEGIVLIFDEVISFRISPGGAQEFYGITPDMTTLGKIIGGGLAVGAFGGREDIMSLYDPSAQGGPKVGHGGTFNANPLTMIAGLAVMEQMTPAAYQHLASLGESLRGRLQHLFDELDFPAQVTGVGSLFNLHFTREAVFDYRSTRRGDLARLRAAVLGLYNEGILLSARGLGALSTPMTEDDIEAFAQATGRVLSRLNA